MLIAKGPYEDIRLVNIGFFSKHPEQFFNRAWIELDWHQDTSGKKFEEIYFKGPLPKQLRDTLCFLKSNIVREHVVKNPNKAESDRFYNYPFDALEEALANAVYHKSYEHGSPIEVQIFKDKITILSHPGPVPPVNSKVLANERRIVVREYPNRRIGDFLKELHITEGRGSGFPTIYDAMATNGSPKPIFKTDDETYVLVTIPVHVGDEASDQASDQVKHLIFKNLDDIVIFCDGASDQVRAILDAEIHGKVAE